MQTYIEQAKTRLSKLGYQFVSIKDKKLSPLNTSLGIVSHLLTFTFEGRKYQIIVTAHTFEKHYYMVGTNGAKFKNKVSINNYFNY